MHNERLVMVININLYFRRFEFGRLLCLSCFEFGCLLYLSCFEFGCLLCLSCFDNYCLNDILNAAISMCDQTGDCEIIYTCLQSIL